MDGKAASRTIDNEYLADRRSNIDDVLRRILGEPGSNVAGGRPQRLERSGCRRAPLDTQAAAVDQYWMARSAGLPPDPDGVRVAPVRGHARNRAAHRIAAMGAGLPPPPSTAPARSTRDTCVFRSLLAGAGGRTGRPRTATRPRGGSGHRPPNVPLEIGGSEPAGNSRGFREVERGVARVGNPLFRGDPGPFRSVRPLRKSWDAFRTANRGLASGAGRLSKTKERGNGLAGLLNATCFRPTRRAEPSQVVLKVDAKIYAEGLDSSPVRARSDRGRHV